MNPGEILDLEAEFDSSNEALLHTVIAENVRLKKALAISQSRYNLQLQINNAMAEQIKALRHQLDLLADTVEVFRLTVQCVYEYIAGVSNDDLKETLTKVYELVLPLARGRN